MAALAIVRLFAHRLAGLAVSGFKAVKQLVGERTVFAAGQVARRDLAAAVKSLQSLKGLRSNLPGSLRILLRNRHKRVLASSPGCVFKAEHFQNAVVCA
jgi:hypothetical protein